MSYGDFVMVSALHFFKLVDEEVYKRVVAIEPALGKVYEASTTWLERDDH